MTRPSPPGTELSHEVAGSSSAVPWQPCPLSQAVCLRSRLGWLKEGKDGRDRLFELQVRCLHAAFACAYWQQLSASVAELPSPEADRTRSIACRLKAANHRVDSLRQRTVLRKAIDRHFALGSSMSIHVNFSGDDKFVHNNFELDLFVTEQAR